MALSGLSKTALRAAIQRGAIRSRQEPYPTGVGYRTLLYAPDLATYLATRRPHNTPR